MKLKFDRPIWGTLVEEYRGYKIFALGSEPIRYNIEGACRFYTIKAAQRYIDKLNANVSRWELREQAELLDDLTVFMERKHDETQDILEVTYPGYIIEQYPVEQYRMIVNRIKKKLKCNLEWR